MKNWLVLITAHITMKKKKKKKECPLEGKCDANDIACKSIDSAIYFPNKVYLGTAQREFKNVFTIIKRLTKTSRKGAIPL